MSDCEQRESVASYLLGALPEDEHARFVGHLVGCQTCSGEIDDLRVVVDALPLAAPPAAPSPDLEGRLMHIVSAEAALLRASGATADEPVPARPERVRPEPKAPWWRPRALALRPLPAAVAASVLLAIGVTAGVLLSNRDGTTTVPAQVRLASAPDATAALLLDDGDRVRLRVRDFPAPAGGDIYQVWLKLRDREAPVSADVLFTPAGDGSATVDLRRDLRGVEQVLVTPEPDGGSPAPTSEPVIVATPA